MTDNQGNTEGQGQPTGQPLYVYTRDVNLPAIAAEVGPVTVPAFGQIGVYGLKDEHGLHLCSADPLVREALQHTDLVRSHPLILVGVGPHHGTPHIGISRYLRDNMSAAVIAHTLIEVAEYLRAHITGVPPTDGV